MMTLQRTGCSLTRRVDVEGITVSQDNPTTSALLIWTLNPKKCDVN